MGHTRILQVAPHSTHVLLLMEQVHDNGTHVLLLMEQVHDNGTHVLLLMEQVHDNHWVYQWNFTVQPCIY